MPKPNAVMDDAASSPEQPHSDPGSLSASIEAILLTSDKPVPPGRLAEALGLGTPPADGPPSGKGDEQAPESAAATAKAIQEAVAALNEAYETTGRAFRIQQVAGGYRIMTLPEYAPVLAAFHRTRTSTRLSRAAVETLAIIAYRQPITRAHLEAIRGVGCGEVLRSLIERKLVTIKGRSEELGRPILYGTTKEFLDAFGLASLKDLPTAAELQVG